MTTTDLPLARDPQLPAVAELLGPDAHHLLTAALRPSGGELLTAAPNDISWWPGSSITVGFAAEVAWPDGTRRAETLVAAAGSSVPDGALLLDGGPIGTVGVWRAPFDPGLPGLAPALAPEVLAGILRDVDVDAEPHTLRTRVLSYRPGRRAVIEVSGTSGRIFLKVVRPHKAEGIHRRHRLLRGHVPVPESLGWSPEHGVVVLQALPGLTQRQSLAQDGPQPGPDAVLQLLDALPEPGDGARSWGWRAHELGGVVAASLPSLAGRVDALADRLAAAEAALPEQAPVPVHGDLHDAQLMVDGPAITGLLDVDTHAMGRRVDDLSTMIGHLSVLATAVPHGARVRDHARRLLGGFDSQVDPVALRYGVASVVLGLATGPFRVQEPEWAEATVARVELAEMWAASADQLAGTRR